MEIVDLGAGWLASVSNIGEPDENISIRNPKTKQQIDLGPSSIAKLREIFKKAETKGGTS